MSSFLMKIIDYCTVDDLIKGYVYDHDRRVYTCIFCGEIFEEDLIYECSEKLCNSRKAVEEHIKNKHGSSFDSLIDLEKKYTGLTDRQNEIYRILYYENDNQIIADKLGTTTSTVRSYKFKIREKLRQVKIYMALSNLIENDKRNEFMRDNVEQSESIEYENQKMLKQFMDKSKESQYDMDLELKKTGDLNLLNKFLGGKGPGGKW